MFFDTESYNSQGFSDDIGRSLEKQLIGVVYSVGKVFDDLSATRMATEEFLRTDNPEVLGSKADRDLLSDLRDATRFVVDYDYENLPFDTDYLRSINTRISRSGALYPGEWRTTEGGVTTVLGHFTPAPVDKNEITQFMEVADNANSQREGYVERAVTLFMQLAKAQPFGDGNKRTAMMAANGLLIKHGSPILLTVPCEDENEIREFIQLMSEWYMESNEDAIVWLSEFNKRKQHNE